MAQRVFVSGGSGYIAGELIRQLLAQGWQVQTSIRDAARAGELRARLGADAGALQVVGADLMRNSARRAAAMAHVASPLPGRWVKKPDDLIVPARDGALRVLRAARDAGVQRFVMTSSVAAIVYGRGRGVPLHRGRLDARRCAGRVALHAVEDAGRAPRSAGRARGRRRRFNRQPVGGARPGVGADYRRRSLVKRLLDGAMLAARPGLRHRRLRDVPICTCAC